MLCENTLKKYNKRLLLSRMRILMNNGFYGLLLMHMIFAVDEKCETAATDGYRIYFGPKFMDDLSDSELDFVLMHEIMHAALNHCKRRSERDGEVYNVACDIVVNSNILYSNNFNNSSITLRKYGEAMHIAPTGDEGYKYTAEEVYEMLIKRFGKYGAQTNNNKNNEDFGDNFERGRAKHKQGEKDEESSWDDHSRWTEEEDDYTLRDVWVKRIEDAAEAISIREKSNSRGTLPLFAKRMLDNLRKPQTDWETVLSDFIQEEICDYSFSPPDRRFGESPFFCPISTGRKLKCPTFFL